MVIEKYADKISGPNIIFDPVPSYNGYWQFSLTNLFKNSKVVNGVNLFEDFYKKTYMQPLFEIFKTKDIFDFKVRMISMPNQNLVGRVLRYNKIDFFTEIALFLSQEIDNYGKTKDEMATEINELLNKIKRPNDELNLAFASSLKIKTAKLKDLKENEINSEYFDAAMKDYTYYRNQMDFTKYINMQYELSHALEEGLMHLENFFDRDIEYNELAKAFDADIFYLLFLKIIYEYNIKYEKENKTLHESYSYFYTYKNLIKDILVDNKLYNPVIIFKNKYGKNELFTRTEIEEDFENLLTRHQEARDMSLGSPKEDDNNKYKDISLMTKVSLLYNNETESNWLFLKDKNIFNIELLDNVHEELSMRWHILENSGFIGNILEGINVFKGYYGFIYDNGKVILENFNDSIKDVLPTYVMDIDVFIKLSKINNNNLIDFMKTLPSNSFKRIFHTNINNWQRNLYREINGESYNLQDVLDFMNDVKDGGVPNEQ